MGQDLKQLIYCSDAREAMDSVALQSLLELARARNAALGITGMLLYSNGRILQVLEGESGPLDALYEQNCERPASRPCTHGDEPKHEGARFFQLEHGLSRFVSKPICRPIRNGTIFSAPFRRKKFPRIRIASTVFATGLSRY
jgi:hypothetical protein